MCFVITNVGWLAQFASDNARDDIVCRSDGVARHQVLVLNIIEVEAISHSQFLMLVLGQKQFISFFKEPRQGENLSCVIIFVLIYFFSQSAAVWIVVVSYSWCVSFSWASQPHKVREILNKRTPYFHMAAWILPFVLTIIILATNKVEGSYISGVCFVGYSSAVDKGLLVYLPVCCAVAISGFFTVRTVRLLLDTIREASKGVLPSEAGAKVRRTVSRILVFSVLLVACVIMTIICHIYKVYGEDSWQSSLKELVLCNIRQQLGETAVCSMESKPSLVMLQLELVTMFTAGVLCSSWVWTSNTASSWLMAFKHLFKQGERPVKLHKHQLIAQAFAKRAELQANGRLSLSFHSAHEDPLGMGQEMEPETSGDFSSDWAAALPHLVQRRGGLCGAEQLGLGRRASLDSVSNISRSISIRSGRFSWFGSRRGSEMSNTMSIQQSDLDRLQSMYDEAVKTNKKRSKREFFKSHKSRMRPWSRSTSRSRRHSITSRGSDNSSVFSQFSQVLPAITLDPKKLQSKVKMNKFSLPSPGKSIDFGRDPRQQQFNVNDPTFIELEEKLRQLASRNSNITDKDGELKITDITNNDGELRISIDVARANTCSIETQTELLDDTISTKLNMISTGTEHLKNFGTYLTPLVEIKQIN